MTTDELNIDDKIDLKIYRIIEERVEKRLSRMQNDLFRLQAQVDELLANRPTSNGTPVFKELSFEDDVKESVSLVDLTDVITTTDSTTTTVESTTTTTEPNEPTDLNEQPIKLKPLQLKQT